MNPAVKNDSLDGGLLCQLAPFRTEAGSELAVPAAPLSGSFEDSLASVSLDPQLTPRGIATKVAAAAGRWGAAPPSHLQSVLL